MLATPAFKDNILSFGVCYGLCLQGLETGGLRTNLLPRQISMDRLIRRKKPWAVAAAALVMLACTVSYAAYVLQYNAVKPEIWKDAIGKAEGVQNESKRWQNGYDTAKQQYVQTSAKGDRLVRNVQDRDRWLKFLTALNECLPPYEVDAKGKIIVEPPPTATDIPVLKKEIMQRNQLLVTNIDSQQVDDVAKWFAVMKDKAWYRPMPGQPGAPELGQSAGAVSPGAQAAGAAAPGVAGATAPSSGPTGPGYIVQIYGRHFHNDRSGVAGAEYVYNTLVTKLASRKMFDLGVSFPVLVQPPSLDIEEIQLPAPKHEGTQGEPGGMMTGPRSPFAPPPDPAADNKEKKVIVPRFRFRVQFVWQPDKAVSGQVAAAGAGGPAGASAPPIQVSTAAPGAKPAAPVATAPAAPAAPPAPAPGPVPKKP